MQRVEKKTHSVELALQSKSVLNFYCSKLWFEKKAWHEKLKTELKFNIGNTGFVLFCFFETVWSFLKNGRFSHKHSGKRKEKKQKKQRNYSWHHVDNQHLITSWFWEPFQLLLTYQGGFFAFNDFLWELMSDAAERRPNKKAERPFVVPEVIKPNHGAPWYAPCVFFHVCV